MSLEQIIAEGVGVGRTSKRVQAEYVRLVGEFGSELSVLTETPTSEVAKVAGERIADGLGRVRRGDIVIEPGYDGRYGAVKVWPE